MRMVLSVTPLSARAGRSRPGPSARAAPPATRVRLEIESFMRRLSLCCCRRRGVAAAAPRTSSSSAGLDVAGLDALYAPGRPLLPGGGQRAVEVDAARGVFDHIGLEAGLACVHRGPGHAEVGGQAGDEHGLDAARLEVAGQAG